MTPFETARTNLHYFADLSFTEAESILKGSGIAPLEEGEEL
jgi:hypothetical protein